MSILSIVLQSIVSFFFVAGAGVTLYGTCYVVRRAGSLKEGAAIVRAVAIRDRYLALVWSTLSLVALSFQVVPIMASALVGLYVVQYSFLALFHWQLQRAQRFTDAF